MPSITAQLQRSATHCRVPGRVHTDIDRGALHQDGAQIRQARLHLANRMLMPAAGARFGVQVTSYADVLAAEAIGPTAGDGHRPQLQCALPSCASVKLDCRPPMPGVSRPRLPWGVRCCCAAARLLPIGEPSALSNAEGLEAMNPVDVATALGDWGMTCRPWRSGITIRQTWVSSGQI